MLVVHVDGKVRGGRRSWRGGLLSWHLFPSLDLVLLVRLIGVPIVGFFDVVRVGSGESFALRRG